MRRIWTRATTVLAIAGIITANAPAFAGPVPGNLGQVGVSAPQHVTDVRWRGRGAGVAAGIAAGVITGAIIAGAARPYYYGPGPYYDGPGYYYGPGYYDPPPYYYAPRYRYRAPVYVEPPPIYVEPPAVYAPRGPNGPVRQCWVSTDKDRGFGYWRPC